jgi:ABC-type Na+ efflux pump permease subunit
MRLSKAWIVTSKDLKIFRKRRSVLYSVIILPLIVALGFPFLTYLIESKGAVLSSPEGIYILNTFAFLFIIWAVVLPTAIAAYTIAGEKIEKSLEPLLATPITDDELLLGKSLAAFLPPIIAIYIGAIIFMVLMDAVTFNALSYLYFPNWTMAVIMLLAAPLAAIMSIEITAIASAKANDIRSAQLLGNLTSLPFGVIYVASELSFITLDTKTMLIISAIIFLIDIVLFFISTKTFQREQILTKWT